MMVCHQVVATLDVVISDLRRDKVIYEMLPWVVAVGTEAGAGCQGVEFRVGGRGRLAKVASDDLSLGKIKKKKANKKSK